MNILKGQDDSQSRKGGMPRDLEEKVEKHSLKFPILNPQLTNTEKEVLHLITEEFLTIKQIAQRRNCSIQAVYKITKSLKKKGVLDMGLNKVEKVQSTFNQSDLRLHGQEFNIRILWQDLDFQRKLKGSNTIFLDGNTIRLYKNSIEIYSGQSFFGKDVDEVEKKSLDYWERFIIRLEHDLKIQLKKNRARNIKIVNQHWARGDSEITDNAIKYRERVWVYAEEDGKLCFITDDSFGFREDETLHPITAKPDRKAIDKQVNDWRLNNPPTNSQIAQGMIQNAQNTKNLIMSVETLVNHTEGLPVVLNRLEQQITSHLALIQEYRKENISWRKHTEKRIRQEVKYGKQTKLTEFL